MNSPGTVNLSRPLPRSVKVGIPGHLKQDCVSVRTSPPPSSAVSKCCVIWPVRYWYHVCAGATEHFFPLSRVQKLNQSNLIGREQSKKVGIIQERVPAVDRHRGHHCGRAKESEIVQTLVFSGRVANTVGCVRMLHENRSPSLGNAIRGRCKNIGVHS